VLLFESFTVCVMTVMVGVNGVVGYSRSSSSTGSSSTMSTEQQPKRQRNYRLIVDPALKQGPTKVYSIEGHIPGVSTDCVHYCNLDVVAAVSL